MKEYLERLPKETRDLILLVRDVAQGKGVPAYLVGGFVRDLLLGENNLDLDIVVEGDGIAFAEQFAKGRNARLIRHRRFGTATVIIGRHSKIDIATARKEFYPLPGSLPSVTPSNLKDDLGRRDVTINAMAVSIAREDFGRLIDYCGGRLDLRKRAIRILHPVSFIDDPTRILRVIRFEQRYGFRIEPRTLRSLKEAAKLHMLERVQPQRVRDELILLLKEKNPIRGIKRLQELAGLKFISGHIRIWRKTYNLLGAIERQIRWYQMLHAHRRPLDAWLIYLLGIIDTLDTEATRNLCQTFVFLKGEEKRMLACKKIDYDFIRALSEPHCKPSRVYALLEPLSYEVILLLKAKYTNAHLVRHIEEFLKIYNGIRIHVSGHDLKNLGVACGPRYQKIFAKVLRARLDGRLKTKEEELNFIKRLTRIK